MCQKVGMCLVNDEHLSKGCKNYPEGAFIEQILESEQQIDNDYDKL